MPGKHTEKAFEDAIEHGLVGRGCVTGKASAFDPATAVLGADFLAFVTRVALSLNGISIATVDLKNHLTGQTVEHAIAQYRGA